MLERLSGTEKLSVLWNIGKGNLSYDKTLFWFVTTFRVFIMFFSSGGNFNRWGGILCEPSSYYLDFGVSFLNLFCGLDSQPPTKANYWNSNQSLLGPDRSKGGDTAGKCLCQTGVSLGFFVWGGNAPPLGGEWWGWNLTGWGGNTT